MVPRVVKAAWLTVKAGMEDGLPGHDKIMGAGSQWEIGVKGRHHGHSQGESAGSKSSNAKEKTN